MPDYCSPSKPPHNHIDTCYDSKELIAIVNAYNDYIKKNKLCYYKTCFKPLPIELRDDDIYLYEELKKRLSIFCKSEFCWTDLDFIKNIPNKELKRSILYYTFKPKPLSSKTAWLSNYDINDIMNQYQDLYKSEFKFLGAQPSDFSKIVKVDWNNLKKYKYVGIIFNTDIHSKPGQHWLAIFIDNNLKTVEYFDSLGKMPNKHILSFLKHFKTYNFTFNKREHQKGGANCGIYSCYFIIQRLNGKSFNDINSKLISSKMMTNLRTVLFRPKV
jgi:hypothetical protein